MKRQYFYAAGFGVLVLFDTLTQISIKLSSNAVGEFSAHPAWLMAAFHTPWLYVAFAGYLGSFVAWMTLLKHAPVGPAFAASHLAIVPILVVSAVIFGEHLTATQMLGSIFIVLGIVFLSFSESAPPMASARSDYARDLQITWVNSEADISPELWERFFPEPFEGRWWYRALEQCGIGDQFTFFYALVSNPAGPVALMPAFLMNVPIRLVLPPLLLPVANLIGRIAPSVLYQRTFFVGSPCSDEGRVGMVESAHRQEVLDCLNLAVQRRADQLNVPMRVWKDFPQSYAKELSGMPGNMFPMVSYPGTSVSLSNASKEAYLAGLKSSYRHNLKKKLKSSASIPLDADVLQQPPETVMDEIFDLFWKTYEKGKTKFEQLNRRFFDLLARHHRSHFVILRERDSGKIVAFMLCFRMGKHFINKFIGIDYQQPKEWFLYYRLWDAAIDFVVSLEGESIQSGQTGYTAKIRLGHKLVPLYNYCSHKNPIIHWIYAMVARNVNWDTLDQELALYLQAHPDEKVSGADGNPVAVGPT